MKEIRGNTRVTTDRPESTYEALTKYGQDLVSQAEKANLTLLLVEIQKLEM